MVYRYDSTGKPRESRLTEDESEEGCPGKGGTRVNLIQNSSTFCFLS
jgi:hypothetical protein